MASNDGIWRGNYFGRTTIGRTKVEVRMRKLKNGKVAGKDEITGEMIKGWWIGSGGYVICPLIVVLCLKTGDLL